MCDIFYDISVNCIANFLFLFVVVAISWLISQIIGRKDILKFFGLLNNKELNIYISNLSIKPFGTIGVDGIERFYNGDAGSIKEVIIANRIKEKVNHLFPLFSDQPGILGQLLLSDTKINIKATYVEENNKSIITLGLPAYNECSMEVERSGISKIKTTLGVIAEEEAGKIVEQPGETMSSVTTAVNIQKILPSGEQPAKEESGYVEENKQEINGTKINISELVELDNPNQGFIERIVDARNRRLIFYIAGLSEYSTFMAAEYLIDNWKKLYKIFHDHKHFVIAIEIRNGNNISVLAEREY